jgi:hypothetical protein
VIDTRRLVFAAAVALLAGCSASSGQTTATPGASTLQPEPSIVRPTPGPNESVGPIDLPASIVDPVVADVAARAGVTPDQVTVISAESKTFPDGGLGCPLPGVSYIQVQVDGYQIVARANGITYDYRGSPTGFRLCSQAVS